MSIPLYCEIEEYIHVAVNRECYGKYEYNGLYEQISQICLKTKEKQQIMHFCIEFEHSISSLKREPSDLEINIIYTDEMDLKYSSVKGICFIQCCVTEPNNIRTISLSQPTNNIVKYFEYIPFAYNNF